MIYTNSRDYAPVTTRTLVSLAALPFIMIPIWLGGPWILGLVVCISLLGGHELYNIMERGNYRPARWIGLPWLVLLVVAHAQPRFIWSQWVYSTLLSPTLLSTIGLILTLTYSLFQTDHPINTWMSTSTGAIYLGVLMGQFLGLRLLTDGFWWLLMGLLLAWANDTLAYLVGSTLGRHKLWPRISPKKTWEGTLAGWLGAALMTSLLGWLSPLSLSPMLGALLGLAGGILALFGDLAISMLKRQVGVKDSGRLLPGHGGVLDRLDSLLFVIPFIYQAALILT